VKVSFERSFLKDLKGLKDRTLFAQVDALISEVKSATTLAEVHHLRKMRGHETYYRLRLGDYRIGIEFLEDTVFFVRILHRKDIYRYFP